jgi:hypothetical protein
VSLLLDERALRELPADSLFPVEKYLLAIRVAVGVQG